MNYLPRACIKKFQDRGYPEEVLKSAILKTETKPREELLKIKTAQSTEENRSVFVSKFSTHSFQIKKLILKHWPMMSMEVDFKGLFALQPRFAYMRSRNFKQILNSPPPKMNQQHKGTVPCLNCGNCNSVIKGNTIKHPSKGTPMKLRVTATCNSQNLIYMLKCPCGKVYVGKTERKIRI